MVRWLRWHCPPDTGFEIRALAVWGRARYLSVTEAPHNTNFHTSMGKKQFCFFQTAETGNRTPDSGVKGSGGNHYPRAPARFVVIQWHFQLEHQSSCIVCTVVQEHVESRGNSVVKICHLYENVQNKPQNKKKFDGVRKWVSKPSYHAKFKIGAMR